MSILDFVVYFTSGSGSLLVGSNRFPLCLAVVVLNLRDKFDFFVRARRSRAPVLIPAPHRQSLRSLRPPFAGCFDRAPLRVASTCNAMSRYFNGVLVRHRLSGQAGWFAATENICMQHCRFFCGTSLCTQMFVYLSCMCLTRVATGDKQCSRSSEFATASVVGQRGLGGFWCLVGRNTANHGRHMRRPEEGIRQHDVVRVCSRRHCSAWHRARELCSLVCATALFTTHCRSSRSTGRMH